MQQLRFVEVSVGVVGVRLQCDVEGIESGLRLSQLRRDAAELRPGFEILLIQFDGNVKSLERAAEIAVAIQSLGEMKVRFGIRRIGHQRAAERFDGVGQSGLFEQMGAPFEPVGLR